MTISSCFAPVIKTISTSFKVGIGMSVLMAVFSSSAALFFTDQFNYPDGTQLGTVTGPWNTSTAGYGDNTSQIKVSAISAQTAPSGFAPAAYNGVVLKPAASVK